MKNIIEQIKTSPHYEGHTKLFEIRQDDLHAYIAIHKRTQSTKAFGATRIYPYSSNKSAIEDALQLSKLMSYKSFFSGLPYAGAKGVILMPKKTFDMYSLLSKYVKYVNTLNGAFITGADLGISPEHVSFMRKKSPHIVGTKVDPVEHTVDGIIESMKVASELLGSKHKLANRSVAIQGVGKIGTALLEKLVSLGVRTLYVTDINTQVRNEVKIRFPQVQIVAPENIYKMKVDIFSPCAVGNVLNVKTIQQLECKIILGGANCQLANRSIADTLHTLGIVYIPDYVVNAGGLISVVDEFEHQLIRQERIFEKLKIIPDTVRSLLTSALQNNSTPLKEAEILAGKVI